MHNDDSILPAILPKKGDVLAVMQARKENSGRLREARVADICGVRKEDEDGD